MHQAGGNVCRSEEVATAAPAAKLSKYQQAKQAEAAKKAKRQQAKQAAKLKPKQAPAPAIGERPYSKQAAVAVESVAADNLPEPVQAAAEEDASVAAVNHSK